MIRIPRYSELYDDKWNALLCLSDKTWPGKRRSINICDGVNALCYLPKTACQWWMLPHVSDYPNNVVLLLSIDLQWVLEYVDDCLREKV